MRQTDFFIEVNLSLVAEPHHKVHGYVTEVGENMAFITSAFSQELEKILAVED